MRQFHLRAFGLLFSGLRINLWLELLIVMLEAALVALFIRDVKLVEISEDSSLAPTRTSLVREDADLAAATTSSAEEVVEEGPGYKVIRLKYAALSFGEWRLREAWDRWQSWGAILGRRAFWRVLVYNVVMVAGEP